MRRLGLVAAVLAWSLAGAVGPARACRCFAEDLRAQLSRTDVAFIGAFVGTNPPEPAMGQEAEFRIRVDEKIKGDPGQEVAVPFTFGGSCGVGAASPEQRGWLVQRRDDGRWYRSGCPSSVPPEQLRGAARPLPPAVGGGPPAVVVAGQFGPFRTAALDGAGRVTGYGGGDSEATAVAVCPGSQVMVDAGAGRLVLRHLRDLSVIRDVAIPDDEGDAAAAACYAADGSDVYLHLGSSILRIRDNALSETWRGRERDYTVSFESGRPSAVVSFIENEHAVVTSVDLRTGKERPLFEHPNRWPRFIPDSSGRRLLATIPPETSYEPALILVVDTAASPPQTVTAQMDHTASAWWAGDERIAVLSRDASFDNPTLHVLDRSLRERWSAPSRLGSITALGDTLYGIYDGGLSSTSLERPSAVRTVFQPGGNILSVAVVPPAPQPDPPPPTAAVTTTTSEAPATTTTTTPASVLSAQSLPPDEGEARGLLLLVALGVLLAAAGATAAAARRGPPLGAAARRSAAHGTLR